MVSGAMTCLAGLNCGWFGPLVPSIAVSQKVPLVEAGSLISVYSGGSLIPLAIGRQLVEKFGGRNCLLAAALLFASGLGILSLGAGIIGMSVGAAALGVGAGLNGISGTICLLRLATGSSAASLGRLNVFFGIGALLGPVVALAGLNSPWSYHAVYAFGALYALVVFMSILFAKGIDVRVPPSDAMGSKFQPFQTPALLYTASVFLYVGIEVALATWLFTYLNASCNLSKDLAGWSMTALWGGLTAGRMTAVQLFKYIPARRIAIAAMGLASCVILLLAMHPGLGAASLAVIFLLGLGFGPIFPTLVSSASERYKQHSASITSLVVTAGALAGITFPLFVGQLFLKFGHRPGMLVLALFSSALPLVFYTVQFRMGKSNSAGMEKSAGAASPRITASSSDPEIGFTTRITSAAELGGKGEPTPAEPLH